MNHFLLKFNYGVEIGAQLAYLGHYAATGDKQILKIAQEEQDHKDELYKILTGYEEAPSPFINMFFWLIGTSIRYACRISPKSLLNFVAQSMEIFAIFSYKMLAKKYPEFSCVFLSMSEAEERHRIYFKEAK